MTYPFFFLSFCFLHSLCGFQCSLSVFADLICLWLALFPFGKKQPLAVVGSSGLEPPTSRLSGVRSNQLSYEPIRLRCLLFAFPFSTKEKASGGDERVRTAGLLLARQALYQLSYTPMPCFFQCTSQHTENYIVRSIRLTNFFSPAL